MNIAVTAVTRTGPRETETGGNMSNRNSLLGRSKAREKLTGEELAALDKVTEPPVSPAPPPKQPAKPPEQKSGGTQRKVQRDLLKFRWSIECPDCGFKVTGNGQPRPGQRLARCGRCKVNLFLEGG